jgi:hypothetical protein
MKENFSVTLVPTYQTTRRHIQDSRIQNLTYGIQIFHGTVVKSKIIFFSEKLGVEGKEMNFAHELR